MSDENEGHVLHVRMSSALVQPIGDVTERGAIGDVEHQEDSGTVSEVRSSQGPDDDDDLVRLISMNMENAISKTSHLEKTIVRLIKQ